MAEMPPINIQIDEDALRAQVRGVIEAAFKEAAFKFLRAADSLSTGIIDDLVHEQVKWELERREKNDE